MDTIWDGTSDLLIFNAIVKIKFTVKKGHKGPDMGKWYVSYSFFKLSLRKGVGQVAQSV
jgi:hypothetical protein